MGEAGLSLRQEERAASSGNGSLALLHVSNLGSALLRVPKWLSVACLGLFVVWLLLDGFVTTAQLAIVAAVAVMAGITIRALQPGCQIRPFSVPKLFEEEGWSPRVVARTLGDTFSLISKVGYSSDLPFILEGEEKLLPKVEVPTVGISASAALDLIRLVLGRSQLVINGEIVASSENQFLLRVRGPDDLPINQGPFKKEDLDRNLSIIAFECARKFAPYNFALALLEAEDEAGALEAATAESRRLDLSNAVRSACLMLRAFILLRRRVSAPTAERPNLFIEATEAVIQAERLTPADPAAVQMRLWCLEQDTSSDPVERARYAKRVKVNRRYRNRREDFRLRFEWLSVSEISRELTEFRLSMAEEQATRAEHSLAELNKSLSLWRAESTRSWVKMARQTSGTLTNLRYPELAERAGSLGEALDRVEARLLELEPDLKRLREEEDKRQQRVSEILEPLRQKNLLAQQRDLEFRTSELLRWSIEANNAVLPPRSRGASAP
jgi:hypothetical protein